MKNQKQRKRKQVQTGDMKTCVKCGQSLPLNAFSPKTGYPGKVVSKCKGCRAVEASEYKKKNKSAVKAGRRRYYEKNAEQEKAYMQKYKSDKLKNDPLFKYTHTLHNALNRYLDKKPFESKYSEIFGLDPYDLEAYLISTALDNYGYWLEFQAYEVDHKIPRHVAKTKDEVDKLFHHTNLQLLTPEDNRAKGKMVPGMGG